MENVRGARREEYGVVRSILLEAFRSDDEARLWDYLVLHEAALKPEHVRLALAGEQPVACTVLLPRTISTPRAPVAGAIVTLVACRPAYQRKGFGGATVKSTLQYMTDHGLSLGVLYGHPTYYPQFGFAPVMPKVLVSAQIDEFPTSDDTGLQPALPEDCEWMNGLYESQLGSCPCTTVRLTEPWMWQPRNQSKLQVFVTGDCSGYAFIEPSEDDMLVVREALCAPETEPSLLAALAHTARKAAKSHLQLKMPPAYPLSRLLLALGGDVTIPPATSGMAAVTRWEAVLPKGFSVVGDGLHHDGQLVMQADNHTLVQLVCGYHGIDEVSQIAGVSVMPDADRDHLRSVFQRYYPKLYEAPFWF